MKFNLIRILEYDFGIKNQICEEKNHSQVTSTTYLHEVCITLIIWQYHDLLPHFVGFQIHLQKM